jgi:hypothetical protein
MRFYIHPINPHYSAVDADNYFNGWHFGIWEYDYPSLDSNLYQFQSQHLEAARDTQKQAELATKSFPNTPKSKKTISLPTNVAPHSLAASQIIDKAINQQIAVEWPWTNNREHEWKENAFLLTGDM